MSMHYQPTYRVTPQKRPLWRRLTPLAWFLIATGLVLAAMLLAGLFKKFMPQRDVPFVLPAASALEATPLSTGLLATPTPAPPTLPPPTPMPTSMSMSTPAPAQVWWAEQMTCSEMDECMPPEQVVNEIIAAFWEWRNAIPFYYYELDMTPEQLAYYYTGEIL
ncbi:MAG: hypothetical protein PVF45_06640, partial [Anaerolineae bacterium]